MFCASASGQTCSTATVGTIQSDGTIASVSPRLGDVYAIRWSNTQTGYVNDDEGSPSTVVVTAPDGIHTITSGIYQVGAGNAELGGSNPTTFEANIAAGFYWNGSTPTWASGTWHWTLNFRDLAGYTCTIASTAFTVLSTWNPSHGFLRHCAANPVNFCTDADGKPFWGDGYDWFPICITNVACTSSLAGVPAHMTAKLNTSTGDLAWVAGVQFITTSQASGIVPYVVACTDFYDCTTYWSITGINSATDATVNTSQTSVLGNGARSGTVDAWQGWERINTGNHGTSYPTALGTTAQILAANGENLIRFSNYNSSMPSLTIPAGAGWLSSGYNLYNQTTGLNVVDAWYAAANAAGVRNDLNGFSAGNESVTYETGNCPSFICNGSTGASNLQHYWAMLAARYAAFGPLWEFHNEQTAGTVPQAWVDAIATVLKSGIAGLMCAPSCPGTGTAADPYSNLVTMNNTLSPTDTNLTFTATSHTAVSWGYDYQILSGLNTFLTNTGGISSWVLPSFQGEMTYSGGGGTAPATQTAGAPSPNVNAKRLITWAYGLNWMANTVFSSLYDNMSLNSSTPNVVQEFYDDLRQRRIYQQFMLGTDGAMAPLAVTVSCTGGCSGTVATAAQGSTTNARVKIDNAASASTIHGATLSLAVPAGCGFGEWWNPYTGAITPMSLAASQPWTIPDFAVDIAWRCGPSPSAAPVAVGGN